MTDPKMLSIIEHMLVGHGIPAERFVSTRKITREIMESVAGGGTVNDVRLIFDKGLKNHGSKYRCNDFNAALLHGAAEQLIVRH